MLGREREADGADVLEPEADGTARRSDGRMVVERSGEPGFLADERPFEARAGVVRRPDRQRGRAEHGESGSDCNPDPGHLASYNADLRRSLQLRKYLRRRRPGG